MTDCDDSNDGNLARLGNRKLAAASAKLVRRGLQSLDAAQNAEARQEHKCQALSPDDIPLPTTIKDGLSEIARSFLEEGRTDFDELVVEFENLLGPGLFDEVADYLPSIIETEEERLKDRPLSVERSEVPVQGTTSFRAASKEFANGNPEVPRQQLPDPETDFVSEAEELISYGRLPEAASILRQAISNMPLNWEPFHDAGGEYEAFFWSEEDFLSFVEHNRGRARPMTVWTSPSYTKAHYLLAYILAEQGDHREALQIIDQGLNLEHDHPRLLCEKAFLLGHLHRQEESLSIYQEAANARPWISASDKAQSLRGQGFSLVELNRLEDAETALRESLNYDPDNKNALKELQYVASLRYERHRAEMLKADPRRYDRLGDLFEAYLEKGQPAIEEWFEKVKEQQGRNRAGKPNH